MNAAHPPAIWFLAIRTGTGTDVFTERLAAGLIGRGLRVGITWLPLRAEYAPWSLPTPRPPVWANVVHINTWLPLRLLPKGLPIVATIHHAVHHPDARSYKGVMRVAYHRWWIAPNERRVLRRADQIVAVSYFVADTTRQTLVDMPMQVIYNGVDTDVYSPGSRQRGPGEPFRLLFVGSWIARKGVDLLAPIMRELGEGFELRYTGGDAAMCDKKEMPPNMYDVGRLLGDSAVVNAMRNADALLFPSRSEGHPLVAIEAMACGLPIVGMRGTSIIEAVTDAQTGVLCPCDDVGAFVSAIREFAVDDLRRTAMGALARADVVARFSKDAMVDAYYRIYSALIAVTETGQQS